MATATSSNLARNRQRWDPTLSKGIARPERSESSGGDRPGHCSLGSNTASSQASLSCRQASALRLWPKSLKKSHRQLWDTRTANATEAPLFSLLLLHVFFNFKWNQCCYMCCCHMETWTKSSTSRRRNGMENMGSSSGSDTHGQ